MTESTKNDILEQIDISIKSGFYDEEDILINVEEYIYGTRFDRKWTKQQINQAYTGRLKEQLTWPEVTDFDKLAQAFDQLNLSGIIALHNAGATKQDGQEDSEEIHENLLKKGIKTKGFCYYHWQDIERVIDKGGLYIGFGDFTNKDVGVLEIGKQVAASLENHGLCLNWDKTAATRMEITHMKWQKRLGNNNCSHERAIRLLSISKN